MLEFEVLREEIVRGRSTPVLHHPTLITRHHHIIMMVILRREREGGREGEKEEGREGDRERDLISQQFHENTYLHEGDG